MNLDERLGRLVAGMLHLGQECRICGHPIVESDLNDVVATKSKSTEAAHGRCWDNALEVMRQMRREGKLDELLSEAVMSNTKSQFYRHVPTGDLLLYIRTDSDGYHVFMDNDGEEHGFHESVFRQDFAPTDEVWDA